MFGLFKNLRVAVRGGCCGVNIVIWAGGTPLYYIG